MKEFMFYIRNGAGGKSGMSPDLHLSFVKKCEAYIGKLQSGGNLVAAQPLVKEGIVLSKEKKNWVNSIVDDPVTHQTGYYHIKARDMNDAIAIAKENPEFEYVTSASIEIHEIKTKEETTSFVYPK
jgi:hypothetical protein